MTKPPPQMNLTLATSTPIQPPGADHNAEDPRNLEDQSIGEVLRRSKNLTEAQVEQIVQHQRRHQMRFGEAAVALRLASADEVLWALSQQFNYSYTKDGVDRSPELIAARDPFGEQAEAFRDLRSQLLSDALSMEGTRRALAVVSPDPGDGKTFFTANLAIVLSQLGGHTLLIDANLRTPRQRELFGIAHGAGLSGVLLGRETTVQAIYKAPDLPGLHVLPAGTIPPNPLELLQRPGFNVLMQELLNKFDHVIVDTPAAAHGADAKVIAAKCGSAIALGRNGHSTMKSLEKLTASLDKGAVKLLGMVMNEH